MKYSRNRAVLITSISLALLMIIIVSLAGCTQSETSPATPAAAAKEVAAKPITLVFNGHDMPDGIQAKYYYGPYFEELSRRSGGRIQIEAHWNAELAGVMDAYNAAANGTIDIVQFMPNMTVSMFPIDDIITFEPWSSNCWKPSQAYYDMVQTFPDLRNEYKDTHLLGEHVMRLRNIGTIKKPVRNFEELKGLKILSSSKWMGARLAALGIVPVSLPPSDMYTSMQKGVIDGAGGGFFTLEDWKFGELYHYEIGDLSYPPTLTNITMSLKAWNSLPADLQQIFDEMNDWFVDNVDKAQIQIEKERYDSALVKFPHIEWIKLSQEDVDKMVAADKPIQDEFAADLNAKGFPGTEIVNEYVKLIEKYNASEYAPDWAR
jgi:TRAP-type C4-dicarboxylate transport system substrate-binding protein